MAPNDCIDAPTWNHLWFLAYLWVYTVVLWLLLKFAAKAMPACYAEYCAHANVQGYSEDWKMGVALDSYAMADAMLKAREVKNGQG